MPRKGELCQGVRFEGSVFTDEQVGRPKFYLPEETRNILRGLKQSTPALRSAFDKCALLYQLALTIGRYHPTVRISYEYASVNAIAQVLSNEYSGSFSNFVINNINNPDEDVSVLLDYIHY